MKRNFLDQVEGQWKRS